MTPRSEQTAGRSRPSPVAAARRDLITGGLVVAAILLFVGLGGRLAAALPSLIGGNGTRADTLLAGAMLLNVALILFGWRRYRDLSHAVRRHAAAEDQARRLSARDPLTGLYNRRALGEAASGLIADGERRGKSLALIVVDLDRFRNVNDVHGHSVGDRLLRAAAEAIEGAAPPSAVCGRLDGDEFACAFLFDPAAPGTIDILADQIVSRFACPFDLGRVQTQITASIGIACFAPDCTTIDGVMRRAEIAVHAAKIQGRDRHVWFDAGMETALQARNATEAGLRAGIPLGQFVPYYEQQIDLDTGRLHGFEVLARWNHPTRGLLTPESFIAVAEETGLIGDMSMSVMRQAFEAARHWDPSLTLSVNVSPGQLKDPWLAQKIVKLLTETGFPPARLEVEITEAGLYENLGVAQSIIASLKNQGIGLALDDFGTGYSSLAHLRSLPFDRIKIDRSFVRSMVYNPDSAAIVNAIAQLGETLGLPITAEGVEDGIIEDRLRAIGCHKGQGWHLGRPMSLNEVRKLLATQAMLPSAREQAVRPPIRSSRPGG